MEARALLATIAVDTFADLVDADDGRTSLREAIALAAVAPGDDTVEVPNVIEGVEAPYRLFNGVLAIDDTSGKLTLQGDAGLSTVSAQGYDSVFSIAPGSRVEMRSIGVTQGLGGVGGGIASYGALTLFDCSVYDNEAVSSGGGIVNYGTLVVTGSRISSNKAADSGGGIASFGELVVTSSQILDNEAEDSGGGLYQEGDRLAITASIIAGNRAFYFLGGGLYSVADTTLEGVTVEDNHGRFGGGVYFAPILDPIGNTLTIRESTLRRNRSDFSGGGLINTGIATVSSSLIAMNQAPRGAGIVSLGAGSLAVDGSTIRDNEAAEYGGGIEANGVQVLTITDSAILGNTAAFGGGISVFGEQVVATVSGSTISGNAATGVGGGVFNLGVLHLVSSTITANSANQVGGVIQGGAFATARNTLIAGNADTYHEWPDLNGEFASQGYNLIGNGNGSIGFGATGDLVGTSDGPIDARLDPLADNGGPTWTHALGPDSPALRAGDPGLEGTADQRGVPRPQGGGIDIGAFEADNTAEAPLLVVHPLETYEGFPILLDIAAALADADGSEVLTVTLSGVPLYADVSPGLNEGGGVWSIPVEDLDELFIRIPENPPGDGILRLTVTATATEVASGQSASTTATLELTVRNFGPTTILDTPPSPVIAGQAVEYRFRAFDVSPVDDPFGFTYTIDWGDGTTSTIGRTPGNGAGATISHRYAAAGTYYIRHYGEDREGDIGVTSGHFLEVGAITPENIQDILEDVAAEGGEFVVRPASDEEVGAFIAALNGVPSPPDGAEIVVTFDLGDGTFQTATPVAVREGVTLVITNGTLVGASPALTMDGGLVILDGVLAVNETDAPTILVRGGTLIVRNSRIEESAGFAQTAILVTGGTVDLGTDAESGENVVNVNGSGELIRNASGVPVSAIDTEFTRNGSPIGPSSVSGLVFEDFNGDGEVNFGEQGIAGVSITLSGIDFLGNPVHLTQGTDGDGAYVFLNLLPGRYAIEEAQPAGYAQGTNALGTAGGTVTLDRFDVLLAAGLDALNYNYGERPVGIAPVSRGQTAGIGFWNNKHGQALIRSLNGGAGTRLGDWLAATFPNMFGAASGANDLTGRSNADVAAFFQSRFVLKGEKLDAQVLATALAVYVTNATLNGTGAGSQYGFVISGGGVGTATFNVGADGGAFGVANGTTMTVLDLLLAVDAQAVDGVLYGGNASRRSKANKVFGAINQAGGI